MPLRLGQGSPRKQGRVSLQQRSLAVTSDRTSSSNFPLSEGYIRLENYSALVEIALRADPALTCPRYGRRDQGIAVQINLVTTGCNVTQSWCNSKFSGSGQDLTAGTLAGAAQLVVGHPFDTIKVSSKTGRNEASRPPAAYGQSLTAAHVTGQAAKPASTKTQRIATL